MEMGGVQSLSPWDAGKCVVSGHLPTRQLPPLLVGRPELKRTVITEDQVLIIPPRTTSMTLLLIGAGGSGGDGQTGPIDEDYGYTAGGGGSGAGVEFTHPIDPRAVYTITIGKPKDGAGGNTSLNKNGIPIVTATGGEPGRIYRTSGGKGGRGGIVIFASNEVFTDRSELPESYGRDGGTTVGGTGGAFGSSGALGANGPSPAENASVYGGGGGGGGYLDGNLKGGRGYQGAVGLTYN